MYREGEGLRHLFPFPKFLNNRNSPPPPNVTLNWYNFVTQHVSLKQTEEVLARGFLAPMPGWQVSRKGHLQAGWEGFVAVVSSGGWAHIPCGQDPLGCRPDTRVR